MWIASTTASDGIAVVAFASVIFLILFGVISLLKWIFRLITGKLDPEKTETVSVVLEKDFHEETGKPEEHENIRNFAFYLHSKLAEKKVGRLAGMIDGEDEMLLCFAGPDAGRIWDLLDGEVKKYSPTKPKRVILEREKQNGGTQVLEPIPWQAGRKPDCQIPSDMEIPQRWLRLSKIARTVGLSGIIGLFGWNALRMYLGKTENEFIDTDLGKSLACPVCIAMVLGLSLGLICNRRINAIKKAAGFGDVESSISNTLKYVFLSVIAIFGLVFLWISFGRAHSP